MEEIFRNREEAGRRLVPFVEKFRADKPIVIALPRGGVPVGWEVARALRAPLDVLVVRKIGAPFQPELGMGAIAEGGVRFVDPRTVRAVGASQEEIEQTIAAETTELERRVLRYRRGRSLPDMRGRTALLVDDGIATGGTIRAAIRALRSLGARKVVVAVPVAAADTAAIIETEADEVICLETPEDLWAIGRWYLDFGQVSDEEVVELLERSRKAMEAMPSMPSSPPSSNPPPPTSIENLDVSIPVARAELDGILSVPENARAIVVFVHGSGSSRLSRRNRYVARELNEAGLATLLFDLLTAEEESVDEIDAHLRFDIPFLAERLIAVTRWVRANPVTSHLQIGYFGASTGAAAALVAAAERGSGIGAVVSRGGRPDLAADSLESVHSPTLLVVGGKDYTVIDLNRTAASRMRCEKVLVIVPGATHLFEEPGALEDVARLASDWFVRHLAGHVISAHP